MTTVTEKLYLHNRLLKSCRSTIVDVTSDGIVLDRTVGFAEGGGQEGDRGRIQDAKGNSIPFTNTTKGVGRALYLDDFPVIQVDTPITHHVSADHSLAIGDEVTLEIDVVRRELLTISHSAAHLVFLGVGEFSEEAVKFVKGCHITEDYCRFDFSVSEKFTAENIDFLQDYVERFVKRNSTVKMFAHPEEKEAWFWESEGAVIPCGGTHVEKNGDVGPVKIKRKNMGRGKERVICNLLNPVPNVDRYT